MIGTVGALVGGLGLFFLGMHMLSENLKTLASRRLRVTAARWTRNRFAGLAWGALAGAVTQSMTALVFILVSMLRSGLISPPRAFPILLGGGLGMTLLVFAMTLDIRLAALYMLGTASLVMLSKRGMRYRASAAAVVGIAIMFLGLVLIKEAVAPLSDEPWFEEVLIWAGGSLFYSFLAATLLTFILQSSSAVCVLGISMATIGVLTIDQVIMFIYGSALGSGLIIWVMSARVTGTSRQLAMYQVINNLLISALLVPALYIELYWDVPLIKAAVLSADLPLGQQMALVYAFLNFPTGLILMATVEWCGRLGERWWPASDVEEMSRTKFIHDHAGDDVETSLVLVDLEQRQMLEVYSRYLDAVRRGEPLDKLREATAEINARIAEFLGDLDARHPGQAIEARNSMHTRQRLLVWLEEQLAELCTMLIALPQSSPLRGFRSSLVEGTDAVLKVLHHALDTGDEELWSYREQLTGSRSELMRNMRRLYSGGESQLNEPESLKVVQITNATEEIFVLLSRFASEVDRSRKGF